MNKIQQKQLSFLEDTFNYYNDDVSRRSVGQREDGTRLCFYKHPVTGNMCAVGRYLEDTLVRFKIIESQSIYAPEGKTFVVSEDRLINQEFIKDESL